MGRQKRQLGFSIVEAVIVVVAIGVIGTTGWFIYQHNKTRPTGATGGNDTTQTQQTTNTNQQTGTTTAATLDIKEWGVHMTLDNTTASLYYYIKPSLPDVAYLSLRTVSGIAPDCAADKTSLAAIARLTEAEQQGIVSGQTPGIAGTIHIGSYWYSYSHPQAGCVYDTPTQQAVDRAQPNFNVNTIDNTFKTLAAD